MLAKNSAWDSRHDKNLTSFIEIHLIVDPMGQPSNQQIRQMLRRLSKDWTQKMYVFTVDYLCFNEGKVGKKITF
jgi:hypothetical protein